MFIWVFWAKEVISGLIFKFAVAMTTQVVILGVVIGCPDGFSIRWDMLYVYALVIEVGEFKSGHIWFLGVVKTAQVVILGVVMGCQDGIFFIFMHFMNLISLIV